MTVTLQQNATSDLGSAMVSPSMDQTDGTWCIESNLPPLMVLSIRSTETLEITVTKTLVTCVNTLMTSYEDITSSTRRVRKKKINFRFYLVISITILTHIVSSLE
jgi:hypothetical protein